MCGTVNRYIPPLSMCIQQRSSQVWKVCSIVILFSDVKRHLFINQNQPPSPAPSRTKASKSVSERTSVSESGPSTHLSTHSQTKTPMTKGIPPPPTPTVLTTKSRKSTNARRRRARRRRVPSALGDYLLGRKGLSILHLRLQDRLGALELLVQLRLRLRARL